MVSAALIGSTAVVSGAGGTEVRLSPAAESVDSGATVEYELVVAEASGGVGTFNATVSLNDSSVATIESVRYADSPAYAKQPDGGASVQLAATGMNTLQSGPVELATVTVQAENSGTVGLSVSVAALGDENGSAYSVTGTEGRVLTVEGQTDDANGSTPTPTETATPTPTDTSTPTPTATETPTEEDSSSSGGSNSDDGDDNDDDTDSGSGDSSDTVTATDTPTGTETTPSDTPTTTATETEHSTETDTKQSTSTQTSSGGPAITPSQTAATDTVEPSGGSPTHLLIVGSMIVAVLGGIIIYRRL
ncbi:hypothetical protein Har1131_20475 [Haloarcula sp. CBA1131]|uniref:hypothetical protein n=1 Tax=Haloarcula sp. CBA1131 TaxID=1853686 RepID=UPI001243C7AC|nr:hypothetical protein [Haloarcula sp. CBA1131]KAA9401004.1 hypothetical protein Har1131_20475 [Haloarcula sp. CBA1131]